MRTLAYWNPFREVVYWNRDLDRVFDQFPHRGAAAGVPMEAYEKDGRYVVRFDLPGVDPKDVEVTAERNLLKVKGERRREHTDEKKGYHYRETSYGSFERHVTLPKGVETDKVSARYLNGVLEISVPVPLKVTGQKVAIQIDGAKSEAPSAAA